MLGTTQAAGIFSKSTTQATRPSGENTSPRMGRRLTRHRLSPSIIINSTLLTSITTATSKTRGTTQAAGIFSKSTTQAPPLYLANTSRPTGPLLTLRCLFQPITTSNISRTLKRTAISRMRGTTQGAGISNNHNLQDAWWDGDANVWKLQQISNSKGPTIPDEYSATEGPEVARQVNASLFVSVYNNQQHFAYIDGNYNIQDAWWDGDTNVWKLQQINNSSNPTINGEYAATNGPPLAVGEVAIFSLFVSVYNDQQDFTYVDNNGNIQDAWYG